MIPESMQVGSRENRSAAAKRDAQIQLRAVSRSRFVQHPAESGGGANLDIRSDGTNQNSLA